MIMDKRIIDFLRSGSCEGLLTVTVKEYPVYRDESRVKRNERAAIAAVKGLKDYEDNGSASALPGDTREWSSGGVTVGEVWGALSLDERMEFLDGCDRVLGRNYLEIEGLDFETLDAVLRAEKQAKAFQRDELRGTRNENGSALPLPCYEGCVVVIGNGEYFEDTMRKIAVFNGIYYQISENIFAVSEDKSDKR